MVLLPALVLLAAALSGDWPAVVVLLGDGCEGGNKRLLGQVDLALAYELLERERIGSRVEEERLATWCVLPTAVDAVAWLLVAQGTGLSGIYVFPAFYSSTAPQVWVQHAARLGGRATAVAKIHRTCMQVSACLLYDCLRPARINAAVEHRRRRKSEKVSGGSRRV